MFKTINLDVGTSDVDLIECPVTLEGAVNALTFDNSGGNSPDAPVTVTLKYYDYSAGTTKTFRDKSVAAGDPFVVEKPINIQSPSRPLAYL